MLEKKRYFQWIFVCLVILATIGIIGTPLAQAQYWQALPPYNLLWPLWSPVLSPVNSAGFAVPLLGELTNSTILPVQPILAWDPAQSLPWALYNIPPILGGGLTYFSPLFGLNPWPPSYLINSSTGLPAPIPLPLGYDLLPPTDITSAIDIIALGNIQYLLDYPTTSFGIPQSSLLTPAEIWGLSLI